MYEGHPFREPPPTKKLSSARLGLRQSRAAKFWGLFLVAAFWNGIVGFQLVLAVHDGPTLFTAILCIFALVGVGLGIAALHAFLALFNPAVEVFVSEAITLGAPMQLRWQLAGRGRSRVRGLVIKLEGLEEATYTRGTDTTTDKHIFFSRTIVDAYRSPEVHDGELTVEVPRNSVPSFTAKHNRIVWRLTFAADIPAWPDIDDEFVVDIAPRRREAT